MTSHATTPFTPLDSSGEPVGRAIPLGLGGLSAGIAAMGDLAVTVDGVPDAARLSAGQFLGDGCWPISTLRRSGPAFVPPISTTSRCIRRPDTTGTAGSRYGSARSIRTWATCSASAPFISTSMRTPAERLSPAPMARYRCGERTLTRKKRLRQRLHRSLSEEPCGWRGRARCGPHRSHPKLNRRRKVQHPIRCRWIRRNALGQRRPLRLNCPSDPFRRRIPMNWEVRPPRRSMKTRNCQTCRRPRRTSPRRLRRTRSEL